MGKYDLAQNVTTKRMQAKSYAEYTAKVAANWGKFMSLVTEATNTEQSDLPTATRSSTPIEQKVDQLLADYNIATNAIVPLVDGAVSAKSLITILVQRGVDVSNWNGTDVLPDEFSPLVTTDQDKTYSLSSIGEEIQATYHSISADMAIMEGFSVSDKANEIISIARDKLSSIFSDGFSDISNTLEAKLTMIKSGASISDYIDSIIVKSGINDVATGSALDFSQSSDISFTGASPASAYCWDTLLDAVSSTVQIAANAAKTAFNWLSSKVSKLFHKVEVKVREIVIDPYDIELVNEDNPLSDYFVDGFFIQRINRSGSYVALNHDVAVALADDVRGKTFMLDFTFGTILAQVTSATARSGNNERTIDYTYSVQMKPKPVDFDGTAIQLLATNRRHQKSIPISPYYYVFRELQFSQVMDVLSAACSSSSLSYLSTSSSEAELLRGFLYGRYLLNTCATLIETQALEASDSTWSSNLYYELYAAYSCGRTWGTSAGSITNADFYKAATELGVLVFQDSQIDYQGSAATGYVNSGEVPDYNSTRPISTDKMLNTFLISQEEEINYPLTFEWFPFATNGIQWGAGRFRIRTDADNISRFNNFVNSAIIIIGVVVVTAITIIALKKASTKAFLKLQGALWKCTDEASTGQLSASSIRLYKRANLKSKMLSALSGSLKTGATSAASSVFQNMPNPFISNDTVKDTTYPDIRGLYTAIGVAAPR